MYAEVDVSPVNLEHECRAEAINGAGNLVNAASEKLSSESPKEAEGTSILAGLDGAPQEQPGCVGGPKDNVHANTDSGEAPHRAV